MPKIMPKLTEEGEKYLSEGLPEVRLYGIVNAKGPLSMDELRKYAEEKNINFNVGFAWLKKNEWIETEKDKVKIARSIPDKVPELKALELVSQNKTPGKKAMQTLIRRRLVIQEREDVVKKAQKLVGREVTNLTPELIKTGLWRKVKLKPYNITATGRKVYAGKRHPYNQFLDMMRAKLVALGFREMTGPSIELEFWNFDALYQAQNHPSRDWTQTYSLKKPKTGTLPEKRIVESIKAAHENGGKTGSTGWGYKWDPKKAARLMPRAHDTAITPRILASKEMKVPGKYFQMVRCFRPDVIDATHGVEFNQMGGVVVGENLSFRDLLGMLKEFVTEITGFEHVRFRPDYFPFTEISVEVSAKHPEMGWVELAGAGLGRPELYEHLGIKTPPLMWGFGIDRLAMMTLNITDIRELFSRNLKWLRNSRALR